MTLNDPSDDSGRLLVINALNTNVGGGRTVLRQIMTELADRLPPNWSVRAFVRRTDDLPRASRIEYRVPKLVGNMWTSRLRFECYGLRKEMGDETADIFLSLQGAGASIAAHHHFVYCHNSLPLLPLPLPEYILSPRVGLSRLIYGALYRYTIPKSATVIVQQAWVRDALARLYKLNRCIVAHPVRVDTEQARPGLLSTHQTRRRLLYPLTAHRYKNAELACRAVALLERDNPGCYHLSLTLSGQENGYARSLKRTFENCKAIDFVGRLQEQELASRYKTSQVLLFPSRLETWGLPISEAKSAGMAVIVADLPYARETVGTYDAAAFVDPDDPHQLAETIRGCWENPSSLKLASSPQPDAPYAATWGELIEQILGVVRSRQDH